MSTSSWYRRTLFNYKGNREYTRTGYEAAATRFTAEDLDVDCSERQFMITGSNSGIGLQTALEVARRGGVIHMVCRNQESAAKARSEIITTTGNDKIHLHIVDLAKPREVIAWAQRFAVQHEKLHVLVHNAGCMVHERKLDEDGVEYNFAVNTLAVHILTLTLMPLLERSEDPRVVTVSSAGLLSVRLDPHDLMHEFLDPFLGSLVYSQNKRQQVVMTLWYAQRYNNIHFSSMHPGWADTTAVRVSIPQFYEMMKDNLRTPAQGADTVVWLAISKAALKHPSGLFFQDREPVSTHFPLAWTKSSIEEEDFLMGNIQDIYTKIYNRILTSDGIAAPSSDTPAASLTTDQLPTPNVATTKPEEPPTQEQKSAESSNNEESKTTQLPLAAETETTSYPVLPPPPSPAEKAVPVKSEVQEIAEIHAPPTSSQLEKDAAPDHSEDAKPSQSQPLEEKTDSTPEENANSTPSTPEKQEKSKDSPVEEKANLTLSTPEKKEESEDSSSDEDANSTPEKKEEIKVSPVDEDVNSTPSTPKKLEESKDSLMDQDVNSTPEKKEEKEDLHDKADDDVSTDSIERLPEP